MSSYMHRYSGRYIKTIKKIQSDPHTFMSFEVADISQKMRPD